MEKMPSRQTLISLLDYNHETGVLRWRERPLSMFSSARACAAWASRYAGKVAGFRAKDGYLMVRIAGQNHLAHRVAWKIATGDEPPAIDHINGVGSDNRLVNLRAVDHSENMKNVKAYSTNSSGHRGVYWSKSARRWEAKIGVSGKVKSLGYFAEFEGAVAARLQAEKDHGFHANHGRQINLDGYRPADWPKE